MTDNNGKKLTIATQRSYKLLSEALISLMCQQSFSSISVVDICEKAMVPRATFYNHFEDKYDLFRYAFTSKFDVFEGALDNYTAGTDGYLNRLLNVTIDYLTQYRGTLTKIMLADDNAATLELQKFLSAKLLEGFRKAGEKNMDFLVPIEPMSEFYSGAILFSVRWWLNRSVNVTKEQMINYVNIMISPNRFIKRKA